MAIRIPRGFERNVPNYQEICEGVRPNEVAAPRVAYTGLPHVRIDQHNYDPIVIDPGTIVGRVSYTGASASAPTLFGTIVPCVLPIGNTVTALSSVITGSTDVSVADGITFASTTADSDVTLSVAGSADAATDWGLPNASGTITTGPVKPIGVVYQPVYSFHLNNLYTNYARNVNFGVVTDYVIMVPATNAEEVAIKEGDIVGVGSGVHYGAGFSNPYNQPFAGRYAKYNQNWAYSDERVVGRCLKKIRIATTSTSSAGTKLGDDTANITLTAEAVTEFGAMSKVQTVPGLSLAGSGTGGVPSRLLDARLDDGTNYPGAVKCYWALVLLIRL